MKKVIKLFLSVLFDLIGMISYVFPVVGEFVDAFWAPLAVFLMGQMYGYQKSKLPMVFVFLEEAMPGMDFIPTFTLMWLYTYFFKGDRSSHELEAKGGVKRL